MQVDQTIDATVARALHQDALRDDPRVAWIIWRDHPLYPGRFISQLTVSRPLPYVVAGEKLAVVHEQLPSGLHRYGRETVDPPEVVEMWMPPQGPTPGAAGLRQVVCHEITTLR